MAATQDYHSAAHGLPQPRKHKLPMSKTLSQWGNSCNKVHLILVRQFLSSESLNPTILFFSYSKVSEHRKATIVKESVPGKGFMWLMIELVPFPTTQHQWWRRIEPQSEQTPHDRQQLRHCYAQPILRMLAKFMQACTIWPLWACSDLAAMSANYPR